MSQIQAINNLELTASQEQMLHETLKKILTSLTKTRSGKRFSDSLRFELGEDQYKSMVQVFSQL